MELAVGRRDFRTFLQRTGISAQTHRAALGRHALLLFHQVDHRMGRRLHFARIRIGQTQHVACEFDHGALHTEADSQERDLVLTCIAHSDDLTFDTAVAEARGHEDTGHPAQLLGHILGCDLFRIDIAQLDLAVVHGPCMDE